MMYFVIVVVLSMGDGVVVTVAKEVPSRVGCDDFSRDVHERFPRSYVGSSCYRHARDD